MCTLSFNCSFLKMVKVEEIWHLSRVWRERTVFLISNLWIKTGKPIVDLKGLQQTGKEWINEINGFGAEFSYWFMSHAGSLLNTTGCGVFALGAISELRGFPDMDNLKNHPLEWTKHLSEKRKGKSKVTLRLRTWPRIKKKICYREEPDI